MKWIWTGHIARMMYDRWKQREDALINGERPLEDVKHIRTNWVQVTPNQHFWINLRWGDIYQ